MTADRGPLRWQTDQDELTIVKMLASGRPVDFVCAALSLSKDAVLTVAMSHGHPDIAKLGWAADILQSNLDRQRREASGATPLLRVARPSPPRPKPVPTKTAPGPAPMPRALSAGVVAITKISYHPANVGRDLGDLRELTASIRARGVLVPVVLEKQPGGAYRLRDGHRRIAAARMAKVTRVTALIHETQLDEADWLLESLEYNERRKGYTVEDKRRVATRLVELYVSKGAIAEAFGTSWSKINTLLEGPRPKPPAPARKPAVSRRELEEFVAMCENQGYGGADVLLMLRALLDGRPWRDVDEASESDPAYAEAIA